jgi:hypothetical protein
MNGTNNLSLSIFLLEKIIRFVKNYINGYFAKIGISTVFIRH